MLQFLFTVLPRIIFHPKTHSTFEQSNVTFSCIVAAKPPTIIQWIKDGIVLHNTSVHQIITNTHFGDCAVFDTPGGCLSHGKLSIINSKPTDSGEYICNTSNKVGITTTNATLHIQGKWVTIYYIHLYMKSFLSNEEGIWPTFESNLWTKLWSSLLHSMSTSVFAIS